MEEDDGGKVMSDGRGARVADAMHTFPKTSHGATTVGQAREFFRDDKVHALLVVRDGLLVAVVERADLAGREDPDLVAGIHARAEEGAARTRGRQ